MLGNVRKYRHVCLGHRGEASIFDASIRLADADGEVREGVGKVGTGKGADGNIDDDDDDDEDDDDGNCREVLL